MEIYRMQGRMDQLRILEATPVEIEGLLAEFAERDKQEAERAAAEAKRKGEVR